ncbi:CocE/NonD family hydrolase [Roseateles violae]|uniref:CocE/NonD family hydrolase n=1 Tax=Roseateles violae TaxID=3058042 RepID=A0ABT8DT33_9BURK|nr:CocE/NonD family hydrolase [Pelomonas sp. PFR6]MDN3921474.1 CocE/NonD family hydrolase [Pelomonas sp. PFR6]
MRDGVRLDTHCWLPVQAVQGKPAPAILLRTPYRESTMGFKRLGVLRYVEAGYAVVIQLVRGTGDSEGRFAFAAPHERSDGFDTVEWIAQQSWCSGAVGMDGSSYAAMTQLAAAVARPPHLRCIAPAVPVLDHFREVPYFGGVFSRQHTLNWPRLLQIDDLSNLTGGFSGAKTMLGNEQVLDRLLSRPLCDAADGMLEGDFLAHYREVLEHPRLDDWWRERTIGPDEFAAIDIPALVVNGNFDLAIGTLMLWRGLEQHAPAAERQLLIGPWDHGQCYAGGAASHGPYTLGDASVLDLGGLRLAFFDRHLKGSGDGLPWRERVRLFVTGRNSWQGLDAFPPRELRTQTWYLDSGGQANSSSGDGRLQRGLPSGPPDRFIDDPAVPFVPALASAREPAGHFDLREREQHHGTLVYDSGPLAEPMTVVGEPLAELLVAADVPDADLVLWLAEHRADGQTIKLAFGQLRLRYRDGFEQERALVPDEPVLARVPMTYIGHELPAGSRLRLLVSGSNFPWADPNPHDGGPVAQATVMRVARQTMLHDAAHPSRLLLPTLP